MSQRPVRAALRQRSDSETNAASIHSLPAAPAVSQKPPVSSWRSSHSSTSSNKTNRKRPASSVSSTTTTRSNTVRSVRSLDSLPPIPPLRISKQRPLLISSPYAPTPGDHSPTATPPRAHVFPRSILKNPFKPSSELPPYDIEDYRQRASSWAADSESAEPVIARMNTPTLRLVEGEEPGAFGGGRISRSGKGKGVESPHSPEYFAQETFPSSPGRSYPEYSGARPVYFDQTVRADDCMPAGRSGTAQAQTNAFARQFPAWARYFYGNKGGRTSLIVEAKAPDDVENIGLAVSDMGGYRPRPRSNGSFPIAQGSSPMTPLDRRANQVRDPESATLWSLPHLDHTPLSHLENINPQLLLFCLGFVFPFAWMIAAFLPLPPMYPSWKGKSHASEPPAEASTKEQAELELRYANAQWWRKINRGMSAVGLIIIGAIIALVVIAAV